MKGLDREQYNRYIFVKVLRKSKEEFKNETKKYETIKLNETMKANLQTKEQLEECKKKAEYEINMILAQRINDEKEFVNTNASSKLVEQFNFKDSRKLSKIQDNAERRSSNTLEAKQFAIKQNQLKHIMQNDIEECAAYLREQRDKMLNMKHAIRDQQFQDITKSIANERPQTAKAAQIAMSKRSNYGTIF
ncbi:hypothetical protein DINM_005823 [Dirofilaria immitis]|nr:hypothetical protein [Dirofilaria immitis]